MISVFRFSEDKEGLFEVIADIYVSMELILSKLSALISLIVFSNVSSGSNVSASKLLFVLSRSKFSSKDEISDRILAAEAIISRWLSLISLIVFSDVGSGSNFYASNLLFILSGSKFSSKGVIYDKLMAAEAILFRWLSFISLIVFSSFGPGLNFSTYIILFILRRSKDNSKDVAILELSHYDGSLTGISLITSVASDIQCVFSW